MVNRKSVKEMSEEEIKHAMLTNARNISLYLSNIDRSTSFIKWYIIIVTLLSVAGWLFIVLQSSTY